jgi:hypothetical protein
MDMEDIIRIIRLIQSGEQAVLLEKFSKQENEKFQRKLRRLEIRQDIAESEFRRALYVHTILDVMGFF